jgi:topoisomerase-4 subunit A
VLGLAECLREWLDHLRDVLIRRSNFRKNQIEHRLEVLGGYLIAYLNLDKVIKIIRTEDEPKPVLIKTFKLTDLQADPSSTCACVICASSRRWKSVVRTRIFATR